LHHRGVNDRRKHTRSRNTATIGPGGPDFFLFPGAGKNEFTARSSESEPCERRTRGTPDALMDIRPAIALVPRMVGHLEL
jgi:hypothetical protein